MRLLVGLAAAAVLWPFVQILWDTWHGDGPATAGNVLALGCAGLTAWLRSERLDACRAGRALPGVLALALACLCYALSLRLDFMTGIEAGVFVGVLALLHLGHGWRGIVAMRLPLVLLALSMPPPAFVVEMLTKAVLDRTVIVVVALLQLWWPEVTSNGYMITMPASHVTIVRDCSGMSSLFLIAPLAVLLLEPYRPYGAVRHVLLGAFALVLALATNTVRVLVSAVLENAGVEGALDGPMHDALGIAGLALAAALLLWVARLAARSHARAMAVPGASR
jgi:exosortase